MNKYNILENLEYKDKVAITVMFESEFSKEIRIVFKQDQVMKEHKTSYPITVEIFEGEILFGVNGKTHTLTRGDIVSLEANVPHDLKANKNSIVRLSLSKKDSINRVKGVLKL
ncbi:cupin domain-containing protein [Malaciobacter marinus]|uniref:Cupin n=1 Tax=Malaciobacter marinus TaxID=505249 RepID=A0A347TJP0_9BACT|nr:cupin domain-containing protein [Malaciobacter marinus]AXX86818.1 Cupin domain-containing protein [Malaciobacter marinus]PHO14786.1 cupin [Malaciobacter marinus]